MLNIILFSERRRVILRIRELLIPGSGNHTGGEKINLVLKNLNHEKCCIKNLFAGYRHGIFAKCMRKS